MCNSYKFELGKRYVVYASQDDKQIGWADQYPTGTKILSIGVCFRVRQDVHAEVRRLGKSR